jgi:hypothetical protein
MYHERFRRATDFLEETIVTCIGDYRRGFGLDLLTALGSTGNLQRYN